MNQAAYTLGPHLGMIKDAAPRQETLKKNKKPLTPEERKQATSS